MNLLFAVIAAQSLLCFYMGWNFFSLKLNRFRKAVDFAVLSLLVSAAVMLLMSFPYYIYK